MNAETKRKMRALAALRLMQSNRHRSFSKAVFHDEVAILNPALGALRRKCVSALAEGGCQTEDLPTFTRWFSMDNEQKATYNHDYLRYADKSIARLERERAAAITTLRERLQKPA